MEICDNIQDYEEAQIKVQQYVSELQTYNKILQVSFFISYLGNRIITLDNTDYGAEASEKNATRKKIQWS